MTSTSSSTNTSKSLTTETLGGHVTKLRTTKLEESAAVFKDLSVTNSNVCKILGVIDGVQNPSLRILAFSNDSFFVLILETD